MEKNQRQKLMRKVSRLSVNAKFYTKILGELFTAEV